MVDHTNYLNLPLETLHANEQLKARSRFLRGEIAEGLLDPLTGAVPGDDPLLMKFHGIYQQDDRDLRQQRRDAVGHVSCPAQPAGRPGTHGAAAR